MEKGDKVALMLPNIPEFFYYCLAVVRSGAVVVLLNTSSTPAELRYLLNNSDAKILIAQDIGQKKDTARFKISLKPAMSLHTVHSGQKPFYGRSQENSRVPDERLATAIDPDDPAMMIYTAGLTGKPLGAVLTHRNLCEELNMIQPIFRREPDDIGLCLIPLFHSFGATVNMLNVIQAGCSTVMMDRLTMDSLFSTIEREKITYICAVPRLYIGMVFYEKAAKYDLSSLKLCVTGGSAMPPDFIPRL